MLIEVARLHGLLLGLLLHLKAGGLGREEGVRVGHTVLVPGGLGLKPSIIGVLLLPLIGLHFGVGSEWVKRTAIRGRGRRRDEEGGEGMVEAEWEARRDRREGYGDMALRSEADNDVAL